MDKQGLATRSIRNHPQGESILRILSAALQAVDPSDAIRRHLQRQGSQLVINQAQTQGKLTINLNQTRRVRLVAFGKASIPMARAIADILDNYLSDGIIITKAGYFENNTSGFLSTQTNIKEHPTQDRLFSIIEAGHPVPDGRSLLAGRQIQAFLSDGKPDDLILVLISGGGSALLVLPAPGITLSDIQRMTDLLLACGANIQQINSIRKHVDLVKGGGLVRLASPARMISLILSDVVGDPIDVIASGPTAPDPSTFSDSLHVIETLVLPYLRDNPATDCLLPKTILERLRLGCSGEIAETLKPGDPLFAGVNNFLVGSNIQAASTALKQAQAEGFHSLLLTTFLQGEARQAGKFFSSLLRQITVSGEPIPRPACMIAGGETTVTLDTSESQTGNCLGGRNQELALGAVADLDELRDVFLISLATDGGDGPTDAAGAVVTGETLGRARALGLDPEVYLRKHDSYHFFEKLDDLLKPGPTQTNVNDLIFTFAL